MLNNLKVSVLVLTKNEQQDLPGCLDSVSWSDDIHVYDSMSTDETVSLAKNYGANIVQREFDNWSSHQNWALSNIKFKYDWVFYIDADERMTPSLIESIKVTLSNEPSCVAYNVQRRDFFMGTWLQHVQSTPFYMRLFKPSKVRYERLVNPLSIADGKVGEVSGYLDHFPFSKGLDHWISRHNSYSRLEAEQIIICKDNTKIHLILRDIFSLSFHARRAALKELFYKAPFRPIIKFIIIYFLKRGFLDGRAGLTYALLQSIYEYFIVIKTREIRSN